ncbi:MAG: ferritin-like domain-containing protein [bacterium]
MTNPSTKTASRREIISGAGKTLSAAGVAVMLSGCAGAVMAGNDEEVSQDVQILNAAIALEYEGIAAYQIAVESGLLQPAVATLGVAFQSHHKEHRDALITSVQTLGGVPVEEKSLNDYAADLNASTLTNQEDILRLALKLEKGAANAYLGLIPSLGNDFHQVAAQMAGDEAYHAAILANALGEPMPKAAFIFG